MGPSVVDGFDNKRVGGGHDRSTCKAREYAIFWFAGIGVDETVGWLQEGQAEDLLLLWEVAVEKDSRYQAAKHCYLADQECIVQGRAAPDRVSDRRQRRYLPVRVAA